MKALVLGGTRFLGRHVVEALVMAGHDVTLFNRGRRAAALFPGLEALRGDRDGGLDALRGRRWDAVIDTCGYVPRVVRQSVDLLREAAGRYVFVSSISVYADAARAGLTESSPVAVLTDAANEDVQQHYGALKAACEQEVLGGFGGRALVLRPGLIVGPFDPTGRFTYWPVRIARGGTVLAPGDPTAPVQFIDARDLAAWMVALIERGEGGTFNATGPAVPTGFGTFLAACVEAAGTAVRLEWVDADFLHDQGVAPWTELPLWLPAEAAGMSQVAVGSALASGLKPRQVLQTVRDTLQWAGADDADPAGGRVAGVGLASEREEALLRAWAARG